MNGGDWCRQTTSRPLPNSSTLNIAFKFPARYVMLAVQGNVSGSLCPVVIGASPRVVLSQDVTGFANGYVRYRQKEAVAAAY